MKANLLMYLLLVTILACSSYAQTTEFTYQGSLQNGGTAANGNYDFEFALFDAVSGGSQLGPTNSRGGVSVSNGTFSVALDFGSEFPGAARYIEVRVRAAGAGAFTVLNPRHLVRSVPYAIESLRLGGITADGFVQNRTSMQQPQPLTGFNISGDGIVGGTLTTMTNKDFGVLTITTAVAPGEIPVVAGYFESSATTGRSFGVEGKTKSPDGIAGVFVTEGGGDVIKGSSGSNPVFRIDGSGNMDLAGKAKIGALGAAGGAVPLCRNDSFEIANCGTAVQEMQEITKYSGGLDIVRGLKPVTFRSRQGGPLNLGLEVNRAAEGSRLLTTTNDKGEVEGVKYDRVGVVLVNAVKEQQAQIEAQQKQIEHQRSVIKSQDARLDRQQAEIDALKSLVCSRNASAPVCKGRN